MGTTTRFLAGGVAACVLATVAAGSGQHPPHPTVPPTQEIEVLDPGVDPTGKAKAVIRTCPDGTKQIDIPPTVLVHKFYYTGDRSFQGPLLTGGPVIVTVSHPKTLERLYVPLVLPPGAPRVTYRRESIRYDYGPQSITLTWGLCGNPRVDYTQATGIGERSRGVVAEAAGGVGAWVQRTGIPNGLRQATAASKNACLATADRVNDVGRMAMVPVVNLARAIPGVQLLTPTPEDRAVRAREAAATAAGATGVNPDSLFVPRRP